MSERRVVRMSRGKPVVRLEAIPGRENHSLDALVLCHRRQGRASASTSISARSRSPADSRPHRAEGVRALKVHAAARR